MNESVDLHTISDAELRILATKYSKLLPKNYVTPDMTRGVPPSDRNDAKVYYSECFQKVYEQEVRKDRYSFPRINVCCFKPNGWSQTDCEEFLSTFYHGYIAFLDKSGMFVDNTYQLRDRVWLIQQLAEIISKNADTA